MSPPSTAASAPNDPTANGWRQYLGVFRYSRRAIALVWQTSRLLTLVLATATVIAGLLPAAAAWVGQLIVDGVVAAIQADAGVPNRLIALVALEGVIMAGIAGGQRAIQTTQSLLRAQLGQRVNVMILEKAQTLQLADFEDSEFYDKLTRARREASSRPLSLVNRTFGLIQNAISLMSFAGLLLGFSPWAVAILVIAGLPQFFSEAKFSGDAFRLFRWRSPDTRRQMYLETVLAREDSAKEVKLFALGPLFLNRYREIFQRLYKEDRRLTLRRDIWGFALGLIATMAFYTTYAWIVLTTVAGGITLGQMTMYLAVFRQGQSAVSASLTAISGMYEDNLYLSNLYEYLEQPVSIGQGTTTTGAMPGDGLRFEGVSFRYPGSERNALEQISLHLTPGRSLALVGDNGSGKTTLIKMLAGLYAPSEGRILLDGTDLQDWRGDVLSARIGIIFQDFMRYQLPVGENIGAGDVRHFNDETRWQRAAEKGLANDFIDSIPGGYHAQLGRWFSDGRELSGGQWQKVAVARAFMREAADILVLDEPTAAMDAGAEAEIFEHFRNLSRDRMAILISHRFSTVRMADEIVVLDQGRIIERGDHPSLLAAQGRYARLFHLQAAGYQ